MSDFSNELTPAQVERLALLVEELGEAQQAVGKILRHGYWSCSPFDKDTEHYNKRDLQIELGHVDCAIDMLAKSGDLSWAAIAESRDAKREGVKKWLHHQAVR